MTTSSRSLLRRAPRAVIVAGIAALALPTAAGAVPSPERVAEVTTLDGVYARVASSAERWEDFGAMSTATSRYAVIDLEADVALLGNLAALQGSRLQMGYYVGCELDVSQGADVTVAASFDTSQQLGASITPGAHINVNPAVEAGIGADVSGNGNGGAGAGTDGGDVSGGVGAGVGVSPEATVSVGADIGADITSTIDGQVAAAQNISPTVTVHVDPGAVARVVLGNKQVVTERARISHRGILVGVDACLGKVTARSFVEFAATGPAEDVSLAIPGPVRRL